MSKWQFTPEVQRIIERSYKGSLQEMADNGEPRPPQPTFPVGERPGRLPRQPKRRTGTAKEGNHDHTTRR